jgi:hypothetical protein
MTWFAEAVQEHGLQVCANAEHDDDGCFYQFLVYIAANSADDARREAKKELIRLLKGRNCLWLRCQPSLVFEPNWGGVDLWIARVRGCAWRRP